MKRYTLPAVAGIVLAVLALSACGRGKPPAQEIVYNGGDGTVTNRISFTDIPSGSDGMSCETPLETGGYVVIDNDTAVPTTTAAPTTAASETREAVLTAASEPVLTMSPSPQTTAPAETAEVAEAMYLGVYNYGAPGVNRESMNDFEYRFSIGGAERLYRIDNGSLLSDGSYDYPIQNILKEGSLYDLTVRNGKVVSASERVTDELYFNPIVSGTPGLHTVSNFLRTAMEPVGTTLYVFGGGWDWQDTGSSVQSRTIGVSPDWVRFFNSHDSGYTYRDRDGDSSQKDARTSYYPYGGYNEYYYTGLDCSGYVGWTVYNTLNSRSGGEGYVTYATRQAKYLSSLGLGDFSRSVQVPDGSRGTVSRPGDIMSIKGHIWISLGTCGDGSVVMLHSTPSDSREGQPGGGVQIGAIGYSENCDAYRLADRYMSVYYPEWYSRYTVTLKSPKSYFNVSADGTGRFRWSGDILPDPDGISGMSAEDALELIFSA